MSSFRFLRWAYQGLLLLFCGGLAWGVLPAMAADSPPLPEGLSAPRQPVHMPTFSLPGINGAAVRAGDLRGKVVIIRFWASW